MTLEQLEARRAMIIAEEENLAAQITARKSKPAIWDIDPHTIDGETYPTDNSGNPGIPLIAAEYSGASTDLLQQRAANIEPGTIVFCKADNCIVKRTSIIATAGTTWKQWWEVYGRPDADHMIQWHTLVAPDEYGI